MTDLYTIDGSCSDAVRFLLDHLGEPYRALPRKEHRAALERLNPEATVPTLVEDGLVLTETTAILVHLAERDAPGLLGDTPAERARVLEGLSMLSTGVYSAYLLHFRPDKYAGSEAGRAEVRAGAGAAIDKALATLARMSGGGTHLALGRLTVCDFLGLVFLRWQRAVDPSGLSRHGLEPLFENLSRQPFAGGSIGNAA